MNRHNHLGARTRGCPRWHIQDGTSHHTSRIECPKYSPGWSMPHMPTHRHCASPGLDCVSPDRSSTVVSCQRVCFSFHLAPTGLRCLFLSSAPLIMSSLLSATCTLPLASQLLNPSVSRQASHNSMRKIRVNLHTYMLNCCIAT